MLKTQQQIKLTQQLGPKPPVASFIANPTSGAAPLTVYFNASASYDPNSGIIANYNGTIDSYVWYFENLSPTYGGKIIAHTYQSSGIYYVKLSVYTVSGLVNSAYATIVVGFTIPQP